MVISIKYGNDNVSISHLSISRNVQSDPEFCNAGNARIGRINTLFPRYKWKIDGKDSKIAWFTSVKDWTWTQKTQRKCSFLFSNRVGHGFPSSKLCSVKSEHVCRCKNFSPQSGWTLKGHPAIIHISATSWATKK